MKQAKTWVLAAILILSGTSLQAQTVSDIHPQGWLKTLMQRQHDGLTGKKNYKCRDWLNKSSDSLNEFCGFKLTSYLCTRKKEKFHDIQSNSLVYRYNVNGLS